jgi:hypothetical protein
VGSNQRQDRERINEDAARKRIQLPTGAHETRAESEEFLRIQQVDAQDVVSHPAICFPACSIQEIAQAMINATTVGYEKSILEVTDIKKLAAH